MSTFATPLEQWLFARDNLRQAIMLHSQADAALKAYQADPLAAWTPIEFHANATGNPHGTTKVDVGLGNVQNYPIATLTDIEESLSTQAYMTPATTQALVSHRLQHIESQASSVVTVTPGATEAVVSLSLGNYQKISMVSAKPIAVEPLSTTEATQVLIKVSKPEGAMPISSTEVTHLVVVEGQDPFLAGNYLLTLTQVGIHIHVQIALLPA